MKHCPQCNRVYYDETLNFCLDDGEKLLYGPKSAEQATAILPATQELIPTRPYRSHDRSDRNYRAALTGELLGSRQRKLQAVLASVMLVLLASAGLLLYRHYSQQPSDTDAAVTPADAPNQPSRVYWEMGEAEQMAFIRARAQYVETMIGDEPKVLDEETVQAIKVEIDDYVEEKDSLSQKPFEEGLRVIYGRASQYAPLIIQAYEARRVPPALGIYQAMIESEYRFDLRSSIGAVGLFQFNPNTAKLYGLQPADFNKPEKQSDAAARLMSDLTSDFGEGSSNATLGLLAFNIGADGAREYLRQVRSLGDQERSFWAIYRHRDKFRDPLPDDGKRYVPRFFAAAIIGESPKEFDLSTPPLTTLRGK